MNIYFCNGDKRIEDVEILKIEVVEGILKEVADVAAIANDASWDLRTDEVSVRRGSNHGYVRIVQIL